MDIKKAVVKDVMHKRVVTVRQDMLVLELARLFDDRHISGAPVVDRAGKLVGVVSKTDLVHHQRSGDRRGGRFDYFQFPEAEGLPPGFHLENPDNSRVKDIMTPAVIATEEDTPVRRAASVMLSKHVHRILVTRGGKLKGIVTAMDLLRVFEGGARKRR